LFINQLDAVSPFILSPVKLNTLLLKQEFFYYITRIFYVSCIKKLGSVYLSFFFIFLFCFSQAEQTLPKPIQLNTHLQIDDEPINPETWKEISLVAKNNKTRQPFKKD
tara:strand:+ start:2190 stop:2513 length:324 start_codon:yes stop_codon:yes gene_type:complete